MARLANISGKEASKAFQKAGWQAIDQVGAISYCQSLGCASTFRFRSTKSYRWALFALSSAMRE
jgi:hypothetical protein